MAYNEIPELLQTNPDDIKRILTDKEFRELNTYKRIFERLDTMFYDLRKQIFDGIMLGSNRFIPYEQLYYDDNIRKNFPYALSYYKNKFYEFITDLLQYIDLYIPGNLDGLEDSIILEVSRIFETLYNFIWSRGYEYFYTMHLPKILSVLRMDDYTAANQLFESYFNEVIDQNLKTVKKLLEISESLSNDGIKASDEFSELLKFYLSLKRLDIRSIEEVFNELRAINKGEKKSNSIMDEFKQWVDDIINGLKQQVIYQTRARDSVIATLNNPDKSTKFKDLIEILQ